MGHIWVSYIRIINGGMYKMKKFYYYARLNDNDVCVEIVSRVDKLTNVQGYVELPEYNETVRYKKWLGDQWSVETYEPEIDTVVQEKLLQLETDNTDLQNANTQLSSKIAELEGTIMELTTIIAGLQGGAN